MTLETRSAERRQVVVIGAGPSGSIASALLKRKGRDVLVLERQKFPRFSIGESLLVHCLDFVAEAGMIEAVDAAGFQNKNGAAFARCDEYSDYDFGERFTPGRPTTYQVQRASFDKLLADEAENAGRGNSLRGRDRGGGQHERTPHAHGAHGGWRGAHHRGGFHTRWQRLRTHAAAAAGARDALRPSRCGRPFLRTWQIAFPPAHSTGTRSASPCTRSSRTFGTGSFPSRMAAARIGVVASKEFLSRYVGTQDQRLRTLIGEDPGLAGLLADAEWDTPARELAGYAANVKSMHGPGFALLGNAAEFLDPVFSSGVTIAMRSASMAAAVLDRQLSGERVDWAQDFEQPLRRGVDCFRAYVEAWYDGRFQTIVFSPGQTDEIRRMISSILAGYAWDESNPFVAQPQRRLELRSPSGARAMSGTRARHRIEPRHRARHRVAPGSGRLTTSSFIAARAARKRMRWRRKLGALGRAVRVLQFDVADRASCVEQLTQGCRGARRVLRRRLQRRPVLRHGLSRHDGRAVGQRDPRQSRRVLQRAAAADHADGPASRARAHRHAFLGVGSRRQSRAGELQRREGRHHRRDESARHRARQAATSR